MGPLVVNRMAVGRPKTECFAGLDGASAGSLKPSVLLVLVVILGDTIF
jgi:hypothetical protein